MPTYTFGNEFDVNEEVQGGQFEPQTMLLSDGRLLAFWFGEDPDIDGSFQGVAARIGTVQTDGSIAWTAAGDVGLATNLSSYQQRPRAVELPDGRILFTWQSANTSGDGSGWGIAARIGTPQANGTISWGSAGEFRVNVSTNFNQFSPQVTELPDGRMLFVWTSYAGTDGSSAGISGRVGTVQADGSISWATAGEFVINEETSGIQATDAPIVVLADGRVLVVWNSDDADVDGSGTGVAGRIGTVQADGSITWGAAGEFTLSEEGQGTQEIPRVIQLADGRLLFVWSSADPDVDGDDTAVAGRIGTAQADGSIAWATAGEFTINEEVQDLQASPNVLQLSDGRLLFLWSSTDPDADGSGYAAVGRIGVAQADGSILWEASGEFTINFESQLDQGSATAVELPDGRVVITWQTQDPDADGNGYAIAGRVVLFNTPPAAADDAFSVGAGDAITAGNLFADNGSGADAAVDGDAFTITAVNGVEANVGVQITLASGALLTVNANGTFDYDPNGATVSDSFSYTIDDGYTGGADTATVIITIISNVAPVAQDDVFSVAEDGSVSGNVFADNGAGVDSDPDTDPFTVSEINGSAGNIGVQITLASGALLTVNADGTFSYDPNNAFTLGLDESEQDTFTYTIDDGNGGTDTATVTIIVNSIDQTLNGTTDPDTLSGGSGDDVVNGLAGADTLNGDDGHDTLNGGGDNDTLNGGAGDDTLDGGSGADVMAGGAGDDTYVVDGAGDSVSENASAGLDSVQSAVSFTLGINVENLTLTGAGNINGIGNNGDNIITGNGGNNVLWGGAEGAGLGADTIYGLGGDDTIHGGEGLDLLYGGGGADTFLSNSAPHIVAGEIYDGGDGFDTIRVDHTGFSDFRLTSVVSIEQVILGNFGTTSAQVAFNVSQIGAGLSSSMTLDAMGTGGSFSLYATSAGTVDLSAWILLNFSSASLNFFGSSGVDTFIGTSGRDSASAGDGNDTLNGGDGDDTLDGGAGDDTINGGAGSDTLSYASAAAAVIVDLALSTQDTLGAGVDTFSGIENITGSAFNDVLTGDANANVLNGGNGNDTYYVGAGDVVTENGTGIDAVYADVSFSLASGAAENLYLSGGDLNGTGNGYNNIIVGTDGANTLIGGGGDDTLSGLGGDDVLELTYWSSYNGVGSVNGGDGTDTLRLNAQYNSQYLQGWTFNSIERLSLVSYGYYYLSPDHGLASSLSVDVSGTAASQGLQLYFVRFSAGAAVVDLSGWTFTNWNSSNNNYIYIYGDQYGASADTLSGSSQRDYIYAFGGADVINGNGGDDYLFAYDGADTVNAGAGNDYVEGGGGADVLDGGTGADNMSGGDGDDTFYADNVGDTTDGGGGVDTVYADVSFSLASNNTENLYLTGGDLNGTGNGLNNIIVGTDGANTLIGGGGDDTLSGLGGDDVLELTYWSSYNGVGSVNGGDGTDTLRLNAQYNSQYLQGWTFNSIERLSLVSYGYYYLSPDHGLASSLSVDVSGTAASQGLQLYFVRFSAGAAVVDLSGWTFTNWNSSNNNYIYIYGDQYGASADTLSGSSQRDYIYAFGGADVINGNGGDDYLFAYDGADTVNAGAGNDYVEGGGGADTVYGGDGADTIYGQGGGSEALYGEAGNDTLSGGESADILDGGTGADSMSGADGNDTFYVDNVGDTTDGGAGVDTVYANVSFTLGPNTENLHLSGGDLNGTGNGLNNIIVGTNGANTLIGGGGNDTLDGAAGLDALSGGAGDDIYVVDNAGDVVTELADEGTDFVQAGISYTLTVHVENLTLLGSAVTGTGNAANNVITGNLAANSLFGVDGADILYGGAGNDVLDGGNQDDQLFGGDNADTLYGRAGNDTLDGGAGSNTLEGGGGDDTYIVRGASDVVVELSASGLDTLISTATRTLGNFQENLTLTGASALNGFGNILANVMIGNDAANTLNGVAGADTLSGNGGIDTLNGGDGNDTLNGGADNDLLDGGNDDDTLNGGDGADQLFGRTQNDTLNGDAGADTLTGGDGDDVLNGGADNDLLDGLNHNDTLSGGDGDDELYGRQNNDTLNGDAGVDTLYGGDGDDVLNGGGDADLLDAGNGIDVLNGGDGDDTLYGRNGNDTLDGGLGNDTLYGGNDADTFVFSTVLGAGNIDVVGGFSVADDTIQLSLSIFSAFGATLDAGEFVIGSAAADGDDYIIYDSTTGALYYDADGVGVGGAVQFATLGTGLALTATDFVGGP